jgi:hypothetical protein
MGELVALLTLMNSCYGSAAEKQKAEGYIILERGLATIPLAGLDVPFHSHYLWSGVMPFRGCESITLHILQLIHFSASPCPSRALRRVPCRRRQPVLSVSAWPNLSPRFFCPPGQPYIS